MKRLHLYYDTRSEFATACCRWAAEQPQLIPLRLHPVRVRPFRSRGQSAPTAVEALWVVSETGLTATGREAWTLLRWALREGRTAAPITNARESATDALHFWEERIRPLPVRVPARQGRAALVPA